VQRAYALADLFLNGHDTDGDSEIAASEGGTLAVYQYAQHMADMPVMSGELVHSQGEDAPHPMEGY
jgi:hypothetical protein